MKTILPVLSVVLVTTFAGWAGDRAVSVDELPQKVIAAVSEYLPGSGIESARADEDDGRRYYDLKVLHRDLLLDIEAGANGRIREIDLNRGYPGLFRLLDREASVSDNIATDELPEKVTASVADFLPGSKILSAARGENDGERFYRLRVRHKDLLLRMDVAKNGKIADIDTAK